MVRRRRCKDQAPPPQTGSNGKLVCLEGCGFACILTTSSPHHQNSPLGFSLLTSQAPVCPSHHQERFLSPGKKIMKVPIEWQWSKVFKTGGNWCKKFNRKFFNFSECKTLIIIQQNNEIIQFYLHADTNMGAYGFVYLSFNTIRLHDSKALPTSHVIL